ncbi:hypothetical protein SCE1572_06640 [Sorangium cellulosum So0157-2]|uniref:Uncharacterized protein n=1 Tax=Sorangium cellulosum So0157-2 TaxID=1254432 RepID=S4XP52_SORCE|nr:hypothetical protein SCE1572_06640 [Sorangium cellulosum So0157-2]
MPSFVTGKGKPGARIVSRKTRAGMPVTASTFFCESISGCGAVIVSPSSGIASVAVAVRLIVLESCDPPTGRSRTIRSIARMPLSA